MLVRRQMDKGGCFCAQCMFKLLALAVLDDHPTGVLVLWVTSSPWWYRCCVCPSDFLLALVFSAAFAVSFPYSINGHRWATILSYCPVHPK